MTRTGLKKMMKSRHPPWGYRKLILKWKEFKMLDWGKPVELENTKALWNDCDRAQKIVNDMFRYTPDNGDEWNPEPKYTKWTGWLSGKRYERYHGDCEDYALAKMRKLIAWGVPKGALRLILCRKATVYHLVLGVTTTKGTIILDNNTKAIWWMDQDKRFLYDWIMWSVPGKFMWESLE